MGLHDLIVEIMESYCGLGANTLHRLITKKMIVNNNKIHTI